MARIGDAAEGRAIIRRALEMLRQRQEEWPTPFREVDERVVVESLKLAGGVWERLEIVDNHTVIVHNRPVWS